MSDNLYYSSVVLKEAFSSAVVDVEMHKVLYQITVKTAADF